jgi:protein-arginine kinase activator protein McsA
MSSHEECYATSNKRKRNEEEHASDHKKTWSESISSNINRIKGRQNSHSAGVDPNSNKKADIKQKEWLASIETLLELLPDPISNELREFASLLAIQHTVLKLFTQPRYRLIYPLDN